MDEQLAGEALAARDRFIEAQHGADSARAEYHYAIRRLHASGGSMREIAGLLGLSHQRVHQIVEEHDAAPGKTLLGRLARGRRPESRPVTRAFQQMAGDASEVMALAEDEARSLAHHYIGTEHILLGLVGSGRGVAAQLLNGTGISPEKARAAVLRIVGRGKGEPPCGSLRLTPRSKMVLELARKEARAGRSARVRGEHLLLGLLEEGRGVGAQVLTGLGGDAGELRRRIGMTGLACSFCGRGGLDVASLAAGPGVYICEGCTRDAGRLITSPGGEPAAGPVSLVPDGHEDAVCSFCGKAQADAGRLAASQIALICGECLALCREIHAGHLN